MWDTNKQAIRSGTVSAFIEAVRGFNGSSHKGTFNPVLESHRACRGLSKETGRGGIRINQVTKQGEQGTVFQG